MKRKVLVVGVGNVNGGIEKIIHNLYRELIKDDYEIDFLTYFDTCYYEEEYCKTGKVYKVSLRRRHPFRSKKETKKLLKEQGKQYDYIWIQMSSASNIDVQKYAKKYTNAKIISHSHAIQAETEGVTHAILIKVLHRIQIKKLWDFTDYAIGCSEEALNYLFGKDFHGDKRVVCNGVELSKYCYDDIYRINFRKSNGIPLDSKIIGHVGRFVPVKNQKFLVNVFLEYKKLDPNAKLFLIGSGPLESELKNLVGENNDDILFLGNRNDVNKLLSVMDYFVFPSLYEGMPVSVVEAQASGLPIVMSDTVPSEVAITDLIHEISLDAGEKRWAEYIYRMSLNNKRKKYNIVMKGSKFDLDIMVNSIKNILE